MRVLAVVVVAVLLTCLVACETRTSPLSYIPRPTAPTEPYTTDPFPPPTQVPAFRRTIVGTVRQVSGGPIAGVQIVGSPNSEGIRPRAVTAEDGSFRIDQTVAEFLSFDKTGYHPVGWSIPPNTFHQEVQTVAIRMQSHILMSSGSPFSSVITSEDATFEGGYPFGDEGQGYECSPCKLVSVSGVENGAMLRVSWSGSIPLAVWAGDLGSYYPPSVAAIASPGTSELLRTTTSRINAILVGLDRSKGHTLTEPVVFTLTVTRP